MGRYWKYFQYVTRHKWFVFLEGLKLFVPFWRLFIHDWDKYLPHMFLPYALRFRNPDGTRRVPLPDATFDFDAALLSHINRHKHHWQYWILVRGDGTTDCLPMPDVFRREMLADWYGAGKAHNMPDTRKWYIQNYDNIQLHPDTRLWIDSRLEVNN